MQKALLITVAILGMIQCHETTNVDECDQRSGRVIGGFHYVSGDFIAEDGNWDYSKWGEYLRDKSSYQPDYGCIPVKKQKSLEEVIEDTERKLYAR